MIWKQRHPQSRKYITHRNAVWGEPIHGHKQYRFIKNFVKFSHVRGLRVMAVDRQTGPFITIVCAPCGGRDKAIITMTIRPMQPWSRGAHVNEASQAAAPRPHCARRDARIVVIRLMTFNMAGKLSVTRMGGDLTERQTHLRPYPKRQTVSLHQYKLLRVMFIITRSSAIAEG